MRQQDEFELPPEIRDGLRALHQPARGMEDCDAAILAAARRAGAAAPFRRWRMAGAAGIAAAVILAVGLGWPRHPAPQAPAYVRTGDIRDAYYLARQLKAHGGGAALEAAWDVNKDGAVDGKDVDALAMAAVRLDRGYAPGAGPALGDGHGKGVTP